MDSWFFHPKMVHVPMALGVLMPLIAGGLTLAWWRGWLPRRAFVVALALQIALLTSGLIAMQSGEREEDRVEQVVPDAAVEAHEHAAEAFVWAGAAVVAVMALALVLGARGLPVAALATAGTLVVLALGYRTGEAGGSLVYRHGAAQAHAVATPVALEHDDD